MIDYDILEKFDSTSQRLREVFTAVMPADFHTRPEEEQRAIQADIDARARFEERIRSRLYENIQFNLQNYHLYAGVDLAWDAAPISKQTLPLMMYAQGRIKLEKVATQLKDLGVADKFIRRGADGTLSLDLPAFFETSVNLVRSFVTRRLAAQSNKYNNLWPYYKYEPRSTGLVAKLRADVLSQIVDEIVDNYDYRHHDTQVMRDMFLYAHSVDFVRASWEKEEQYKKIIPVAGQVGFDVEVETVKEGLGWVNPHPSRVFWDNAYPLTSLNSDSGCTYVGFWDVKRYSDIRGNMAFFNRERISYSTNLWALYSTYLDYFNQYLTSVKPPALDKVVMDPAAGNDRLANIGIYNGTLEDTSVFYCEYFEKVIPKEIGVGDYPFPVWLRLCIASDSTVIFGEFMPSTPAAVCSLNENDSRQVNISFAHELMAYQDQMTNLVSQMLLTVQQELLKVIGLNTDVITDPKHIQYIREKLAGKSYATTPVVLEYSLSKLREMGIDTKEVMAIHETRLGQSLTTIFQAMLNLVQLVEKLMAMSPAENGQPAPREITATEVNEISATTSAVYSFISDAIDEFRAAKKRIVYEALMCKGSDSFEAPVVNRYTKDTIAKAGLTPKPDEEENFSDPNRRRHTLIGSLGKLRHNYIFTTRDGAERAVNTQAANTLVQLLGQVINVPTVLQAMGKEKLYEILNEVFRLSGCGVDLNLELKEGEDNSLGVDQVQQLAQGVAQLQQFLQQLAQAVQKNSQDLADQEQVNAQQQEALQSVAQLARHVQKCAEDIQTLFQKFNEQKSLTE